MSFFSRVKSELSLIPGTLQALPGEIKKTVINIGKSGFVPGDELAKGLGVTFGLSGLKKQQDEIDENYNRLQGNVIERMREAKAQGDQASYDRMKKLATSYGDNEVGVVEAAIKDAPTNLQVIASSAEAALIAATGGWKAGDALTRSFKLTSSAMLKALSATNKVKSLSRLTQLGAKLGVDETAKMIAREGAIGSSLFALTAAQDKDATTEDIVRAGEMGLFVGPIVVAGFGALGKGLGFVGGKIAKGVGGAIESLEQKATNALAPQIATEGSQIEKTLSHIGEKSTIKKIAAETFLKSVQAVRGFKNKWVDRYSSISRIEDLIEEIKGAPLKDKEKMYTQARLLDSAADAEAETKLVNLANNLREYEDLLPNKAKAYITQLDFIDRAKLGQTVAGGQTLGELQLGLRRMIAEIGPRDMQRVGYVRQIVRDFHVQTLQDRVDAGLISKDFMDTLMETHPNYIPHNVLMDMDEKVVNTLSAGGSLNVAKTDIMKALGSLKDIEDPFVAIAQRTPIATRTVGKNKLLNNLIEAQEKYNAVPGMTPLRTAKDVKRRIEIFTQLKQLRKELEVRQRQLSGDKKFSAEITSRLKNIDEEIGSLTEQFSVDFGTFLAGGRTSISSAATSTRTIPDRFIPLAQKARIGSQELPIVGVRGKNVIPKSIEEFDLLPFDKQLEVFNDLPSSIQDQIMGAYGEVGAVGGTPLEDMANKIASGKMKVRVPVDIKTDVMGTLGKGNYMRIFRNDPSLSALDEIAFDLGVSSSELVEAIYNATGKRATQKAGALLSRAALKDATPFAIFSKDVEVMKAFESGQLERAGFKTLQDFYNAATKPYVSFEGGVEKEIQVSIKKLISQATEEEKLIARKDILKNIHLVSAEDSVKLLDSIVNDIKATRSSLFQEAKALAEKKLPAHMEKISFFREGIREDWAIPRDLAESIKATDVPVTPGWFNLLTTPSALLKKMATSLNLSFTLPNKFRDEQTALLTAGSFIEELAKKSGVARRTVSMSDTQIKAMYKANGALGSSIFKEGDQQVFRRLQSRGIAEMISEYKNPLNLINKLNEVMEQSTRMEVFKQALKRGLSPMDATFVSRNATIDFAKMGTWMRPLNRAIPFLNARVQGFINLPKAFIANPEVFARMQLYTSVYPTMLMHQHNRRFDSYKSISQYYKDKYWIVMTGEVEAPDAYTGQMIKVPQFITIPKGEGQALVASPIGYFLDKADGVDYRSVSAMIADVLGSASPLEFQTFGQGNFATSLMSQLGPLATIPIGLATNQNLYFGKPIVPDDRLKASPAKQYEKTTPEITKKIGEMLNVSPAKIEFILSSFGGLPQDVQRGADLVFGMFREGDLTEQMKEKSLSGTAFGAATQLPLARRFAREATDFYGPESDFRKSQKRELETPIIDRTIDFKERAIEILETMNKKGTREEKLNYLNSLGDEMTGNMRKKIKSIQMRRQSIEVLSPNDSVELRARYIMMRLAEMSSDGIGRQDQLELLNELKDANILTDNVKRAIMILRRRNQ